MFGVYWMMRVLYTLQAEGTVRIDRPSARRARSTCGSRPPGRAGKIQINLQNRTMEYLAVSGGPELPTGTKVVVVGVITPDTVEVQPAARSRAVGDRLGKEHAMSSLSLFAADPPVGNDFVMYLVAIVVLIVMFFLMFVFLVRRFYKRCPSNRVLVIYGKVGPRPRGGHVHPRRRRRSSVPLIQDYAWLSLEPMQIEIPLRGALSMENIRVNVPSVFTVAIGTTPELMQNAAIRLLGLNSDGDPEAGRGHHLRPAPPGDRLDADRGHQPRPRQVPRSTSRTRSSRSCARSAWC